MKKNSLHLPSFKALSLLVLLFLCFSSQVHAATIPTVYSPKSTYLSPEKKAPMPFTSLGASWHQVKPDGTNASLAVRFLNQKDKTWTAWFTLQADIDGQNNEQYPSAFLSTDLTDTFQYRIILESSSLQMTPLIENIHFTFINAKDKIQPVSTNEVAALNNIPLNTSILGTNTPVRIISRNEWGADESLRYYKDNLPPPQLVPTEDGYDDKYSDELKIVKKVTQENGKTLTWPLEYPEKISKIIIHHTATTKNLDDPKQAIRDIYYWHAITRGWGDIGYNYIIDQQGNIYEGRYGGEGVVGAHAGKDNVGSIGIAVLGNYQDSEVPVPVIKSLVAFIKSKTDKYHIDPTGSSNFRGQWLPNILGHRDVKSTSCPGEKLYIQLPAIRAMVKGEFKPTIVDSRTPNEKSYDFTLQNNIPLIEFEPGQKQNINITLKNTGTQSWGPNTVIGVSKDDTFLNFLVSDTMITSAKTTKTVKPGESFSFNLPLQAGFKGGIAQFEIFPLIDSQTKIQKYLRIPMQVNNGNFDYEVKNIALKNPYLHIGEQTEALIEVQNTGSVTWKKSGQGKVTLGTENPRDHLSQLLAKPDTRLATLQEDEVKPGQSGHFKVAITAPNTLGAIQDDFSLVMEGVTWFPFKQKSLGIYVYQNKYASEYQFNDPGVVAPGQRKAVSLNFKNTGGVIWNKDGTLQFGITPATGLSISNVNVTPTNIEPGQMATVSFTIQAPQIQGTYTLQIMPKLGVKNLLVNPQKINIFVGNQPTTIPTTTQAKKVRVDLSYKGNPVISANGTFSLTQGGKILAQFAPNEKVSVTYAQQQYTVKGSNKMFVTAIPPHFEPSSGSVVRIDNFDHHPDWKPEVNDNEYRGALEVDFYQNELQVINELPIEDYLKGLAEISATDPYEKIKAVIVLARTYATYYSSGIQHKFPGAPFDLTDDPERSQKYLGYGFEKRNPTGVRAVNDTKGIVVTYQGKIIKTPYFSSDDGRTRSAQEVWGWQDTPYLKSVDDPGCKGKTMQGHGVGLSGCGAYYFAKLGKTYNQIIQYYFQGVQVSQK